MSPAGKLTDLARAALRVAAMELRTGLRDRQAMVYVVLMPLALYPILFWIMLQGALVMEGERERTTVTAAVSAGSPDAAEELLAALSAPVADASPAPVELRPGEPEALAAVRTGALDAALLFPGAPLSAEVQALRAAADGPETLLLYDGSKSRSMLAKKRSEARLAALAEAERLAAVDGDAAALEAFRIEQVSLASRVEESAFILSFLLPMMFCIMTVLGAFFPAVDLSAGEKERGTAETTLLLPVSRLGVLLGKILCIAAFALVATTLNIAGLLVAAEHLLSGLGESFQFEVPWSAFPQAAPLLLLFLVSTSAILFAVASFADTFKQGQSLLGPVQMFVLVPAIIVSMPGIELTPLLALVPVAQTALAFKAILQGEATTTLLALVAVSETVYACLAVGIALRIGSNEARALGGGAPRKSKQRRGLAALFSRKAKP